MLLVADFDQFADQGGGGGEAHTVWGFGWTLPRRLAGIRSHASLLLSSGADVKVCQESLRHANVRIMLGLYAQSLAEDKRTAQSKVMEMILPHTAQPLAKAG